MENSTLVKPNLFLSHGYSKRYEKVTSRSLVQEPSSTKSSSFPPPKNQPSPLYQDSVRATGPAPKLYTSPRKVVPASITSPL